MKKILLSSSLFIISIISAFAQPANDACAGAQSVTPDGTCVAGTTVLAADNWVGTVACQSGNNHPEVWFTFVSTGTQANFTITSGTLTGNIELILVEATGPCTGLILAGSSCGVSPLSATFNGLTVGTTYYYTISSSTSSQGTFTACVTTSSPPPVSGQDCGTAAILCNSSPFAQGSSTAGAGAVFGNASNENLSALGCLLTDERQSLWYKFTVGCTGTVEFLVNPNTNTDDYDWAIYNITTSGCALTPGGAAPGGATQIACNYSGCPGNTGILNALTDPCTVTDFLNCAGAPGTCQAGDVAQFSIAPPTLIAGNTYALIIDNFSLSNNGFAFQWLPGGTAKIGPDAVFTMTISNCGLTVTPTKSCATSNSTYLWSYGDGSTSTLASPGAYTYASGGSYIVSLSVTDALGCTDNYSLTVNAPTANANVDQTICAGSTVTLAGSIGGSATSGTWSGGGGVFTPSATTLGATYTPTAANIAAGTVTLTLTPSDISGPCPISADLMIITINPAPVATFSYTGTPYCQNAANPSPTFSGGGVAGIFSSTAGLVFVSTATGQINLSASTAGTYTVTNTIAAASGCPVVTATSTITITPLPIATFSYTGTPYCQNAANPSPTFSGGGVAGIFSSTAGLVFVSTATGQVNLSASTAGTYTVTNTIAAASGCPVVTATSTITITPLPVGTFSYTGTPYCQNAANPSPTFSGGGVAGIFSSTAGLVFVSTATGQINLSASTAGTYTVTNTIAAASGCPVVTATSTITITPLPIATFSYTGTPYCQNAANPSPTFSGGGVAGIFSSTAGLVFVSTATGQINLSASTAGTYTVTNTIAAASGCPVVTATSTITITAMQSAAFNYTPSTFCQSGPNPTPTITGVGGGTFTSAPAGLVFVSSSTGQINLLGSALNTYTITYTTPGPCASIATASVTITTSPVATFSYTGTPYCQNAANPLPTFSGGGSAGTFSSTAGLVFVSTGTGQVNLSASTPGTYTVTNSIAASAGCPAVAATSTITITPLPIATFIYTGTPYCQNAANPSPTFSGGGVAGIFSSTAGLVFVSTATGQVNLSASTAGTYTVTNTIAAASGCPVVTATSTITITSLPIATFSYTGTPYCQNAANPSPTFSGGGLAGTFSSTAGLVFVSTATGQIDLIGSTTGTYTVTNTIAAASGCPAVTATATITINPVQNSAFTYSSSTFCQTGVDPSPTITGVVGGTFTSAPAGMIINAATGTITLATTAINTYTVTYTSLGPCATSSTFSITITTSPSAAFSYAGPYCQCGGPNPSPTFGAGSAGVFSSTAGLVFVSTSTGQVDICASTSGTYTVTNDIAAAGGCASATASTFVTIDAPATVSAGVDTSICAGDTYLLAGAMGGSASSITWSTTTGGIFDNANLTTATYTPSSTDISNGSVILTITSDDPTGACSFVTDVMTLTINPQEDASFNYGGTLFCATGSNPTPTITGTPGGTFTSVGTITVNPTTGVIDLLGTSLGTYTITYTTVGTCLAIDSVIITISTSPLANFSYASPYCQSAGGTDLPTFGLGAGGGVFSSTVGLSLIGASGQVDIGLSAPGTYIVYNNIAASGGCAATIDSATVIIDQPATAAAGIDSAICAGTNYNTAGGIGGSASSLTWSTTGSGTFGSITSGSTAYTPSSSDSLAGSVMLIITSDDPSGTCNAIADTMLLSINMLPNADAGTIQTLTCGSSTATLNGSSTSVGAGFSWSGPGIFSGGSTATPTVNLVGTYTVTITVGSCSSTDTVSVISNINAPNADAGSIQILTCTILSVSLGGSSTTIGTTFSWAGAGIVSGGSTATPTVNLGGIYTVTVTNPANNCTSTDTVSVLSNTISPVADAGTIQAIGCGMLSATLDGSSSSSGVNFSYNWTTSGGNIVSGGTTTAPIVDQNGVYTIIVTNLSNGCTATDTVSVLGSPTPVASFGANPTIGAPPLTVSFTNSSSNSNTYFWDFGDGNTSIGTSPADIYTAPGTYIVILISSFNSQCPDTAQATIIVYDNFTLVIPNVFSPNGDGNNDIFFMTSTGVAEFKGAIYDRWGLKLMELDNIKIGWDGRTSAGIIVSDGTYYYIFSVKAQDGTEHPYQGFIQLVR